MMICDSCSWVFEISKASLTNWKDHANGLGVCARVKQKEFLCATDSKKKKKAEDEKYLLKNCLRSLVPRMFDLDMAY